MNLQMKLYQYGTKGKIKYFPLEVQNSPKNF